MPSTNPPSSLRHRTIQRRAMDRNRRGARTGVLLLLECRQDLLQVCVWLDGSLPARSRATPISRLAQRWRLVFPRAGGYGLSLLAVGYRRFVGLCIPECRRLNGGRGIPGGADPPSPTATCSAARRCVSRCSCCPSGSSAASRSQRRSTACSSVGWSSVRRARASSACSKHMTASR